jgi:hypothetical protein
MEQGRTKAQTTWPGRKKQYLQHGSFLKYSIGALLGDRNSALSIMNLFLTLSIPSLERSRETEYIIDRHLVPRAPTLVAGGKIKNTFS